MRLWITKWTFNISLGYTYRLNYINFEKCWCWISNLSNYFVVNVAQTTKFTQYAGGYFTGEGGGNGILESNLQVVNNLSICEAMKLR